VEAPRVTFQLLPRVVREETSGYSPKTQESCAPLRDHGETAKKVTQGQKSDSGGKIQRSMKGFTEDSKARAVCTKAKLDAGAIWGGKKSKKWILCSGSPRGGVLPAKEVAGEAAS